jgi:hypothetical protein
MGDSPKQPITKMDLKNYPCEINFTRYISKIHTIKIPKPIMNLFTLVSLLISGMIPDAAI